MKKEFAVFVGLIFLIMISGSIAAVEAPLWEFEQVSYVGPLLSYENLRDGYVLLYPADWFIKRFVSEKYTFTAFVKEDAGEVISIFTTVVNASGDLDFAALVKKLFTGKGIEVVKEEVVNWAEGMPGYRIELLKTEGSLVIQMTVLIVENEGKYYLIGGQATPEYFVKYKRVIKQTIDSLKIITVKKE